MCSWLKWNGNWNRNRNYHWCGRDRVEDYWFLFFIFGLVSTRRKFQFVVLLVCFSCRWLVQLNLEICNLGDDPWLNLVLLFQIEEEGGESVWLGEWSCGGKIRWEVCVEEGREGEGEGEGERER